MIMWPPGLHLLGGWQDFAFVEDPSECVPPSSLSYKNVKHFKIRRMYASCKHSRSSWTLLNAVIYYNFMPYEWLAMKLIPLKIPCNTSAPFFNRKIKRQTHHCTICHLFPWEEVDLEFWPHLFDLMINNIYFLETILLWNKFQILSCWNYRLCAIKSASFIISQ